MTTPLLTIPPAPPRLPAGERRTRWAPSPTGRLHLGHIFHTLAVWGGAQRLGAQILLRFEDHDRQRCKDEYLTAAWQDLSDLGFLSCGAICNPDPPFYRQSEQQERYLAAFTALHARGLVYACQCSRKDLKGLRRYPGTCRDLGLPVSLAKGHPYSLRLQLPEDGLEQAQDLSGRQISGNPYNSAGDFVIRDRNGHWSYQFCVVLDDNVDGINIIIRGMDLEPSTLWQHSLARLYAGTVGDILYWHHPLLASPAGHKLGKRVKSKPVRQWLNEGYAPELLIAAAVHGLSPDEAIHGKLAPLSVKDWLAMIDDESKKGDDGT